MARGIGKYDAIAQAAHFLAQAQGVIIIVYGGEKGDGCGARLSPELMARVPADLRAIAAQIEADLGAPHYPPL